MNNGDTWMAINTGLPGLDFVLGIMALIVNTSGHVFAGVRTGNLCCGYGVYRSTDNGATWTPINAGLTNLEVRTLALNASEIIFAGTNGSGVFRSVESTTP
jgi:hypothetical protein